MESSTECPICGWREFTSLQEHLEAHSKADLINLLLLQQNPLATTTASVSLKSGKVILPGFNYEEEISESNLSIVSCTSQSPGGSRSLTNLEPVNPIGIKSDLNISHYEEEEDSTRFDLVPVCSFSVPLNQVHETSQTQHQNDTHQEVILLQSYPDNSDTSTHIDFSRSQENIQEESDNATSQTSIIKYLHQSEEKEREDGWVLNSRHKNEWRTIPVYSSFTEVHIVSKPGTSSSGRENANDSAERVQLQLDLMTDEQIPPRGEISEYEESNTSSFVSEDSNIRLVSLSDSRRVSPVVSAEMDKIAARKQKRKRRISATSGVSHEFLCYECPKVQKFKSLFELIGHKMKLHPNRKGSSSVSVGPSSSSLLISNVDDEKILPEVEEPPLVVDRSETRKEPKKKVNRKEFFCVYCDFISNNKNELSRHMEISHLDKPAKPNIFECNTCGKTFGGRTNLRKHLLVHKERKHVCVTCGKGFTSNFKLMEHFRVHTKIYPYKCEVCEKSYRTPSLLNHHVKHVHCPESERPVRQKVEFYCGVCHKVLRSKRSYLCHTQVHHAKPKKCPFCCETFIRPSVLVRHIRVTHDPQYESTDSKDCPVCLKKLHPNSLIKHMRIHENEKPYPCQVCGKFFRTKANLISHSWSHTNLDKPFKCKLCPKSYLFKKTLEHHVMVHKKRTLHFTCNECGVKFTHKVNMKRHLEEHNSEKRFKCKTCGKKFQRNYYLLEHERIHSGIKPFICSICGKASTTKSNHRAHLKIHDARESGSQEG